METGSGASAAGGGLMLLYIAVMVLMIASLWKVYAKAGKPGWAGIVPIYNVIVLLQIVGKPTWWLLLYFVPVANIVVGIIVMVELAKAFGKGTGYAMGLLFLSPIFMPMLAFGSAEYQAVQEAPATD